MDDLDLTASLLRPLLVSKTRAKLLAVFLNNPGKIFYVRELVRAVSEQINAVRAELARLEKAGMVASENRANRKFFGFKKEYLFQPELANIIAKASGLGGDIVSDRNKLGKIKYAALSTGFVRRRPAGAADVGLLIFGTR